MKKSKNYVGIDISKLSFDVAIYNSKDKYKYYKFSNNQEGFLLLLDVLNSSESICVMEASGSYYLKLATFLSAKKIDVCVINPLVIRRFSQMRMSRTKTDKKDAMLIAEYGKTEKPALWEADADYVLELKQMQAFLEQLNKNRTGFIRQMEAFNHSSNKSLIVDKSLKSVLIKIEQEIAEIEIKMEIIIKKYHQEMFEQLQSIPGLGKKTSLFLIVISGGFSKFKNHKQLASYVGISPRIFESGTSVKGRSKICKMGMSKIRAMLYVCAWSAKRCNKVCKDLYDRLVEKGKSKKLALIAVVNKLLKQAFAIATKKEYYSLKIN
ncbi:IS110 family RNA-guided transposase [Flavobacterium oreochromis]|uniref:IS110 family transposase n=2 Tax=Flavobacterium TaxID=237 RepID=A0A246G6V0_9FLAO|nr:IS110 family transposase [Flavobacterium oreochromis]OWP73941.1 IS110 family transposase [Flavobacterium oreochromis]OWP73962.1 IS110 family transposase [Flavobacterium oreochromis]